MKKYKYYESYFHKTEGSVDVVINIERGEIIQLPSGFRYGIRYDKELRQWFAIDLISGMLIAKHKSNPELQLYIRQNEDRIERAINYGLTYAGNFKKAADEIKRMLNEHDSIMIEMEADLAAYIMSNGFGRFGK